jgi:ketosteroid isomerase-like protein
VNAEPSPVESARLGRQFATALARSDVEVLAETLSPDAVWHFPGRDHQLAGDHRGLAAIAEFGGKVSELTAGTFGMEVRDVYGSEAGAVISFTGRATRPDGRRLENPTTLVVRFAKGRVEELWEFVWDTEAVAAFWR